MEEPHPQVVAAARRGDVGAFEQLVRIYQADIWRLCFHLLGSNEAADDATQEAFLRVFRFLPRYRGASKFSTWLFSIARNCAMDEIRRAGRRRKLSEALQHQPERASARDQMGVEVREALAALDPPLREAVVVIDVLGRSYQEAAAMLRLPVGTVKSRVHRARTLLAAQLSEGAAGKGRHA